MLIPYLKRNSKILYKYILQEAMEIILFLEHVFLQMCRFVKIWNMKL